MDPVTMAFYAVVCGVLGVFAPSLGTYWKRLIVGGIVGLVAATVLPVLKTML